jgi:hypothetical protein
MSTALPIRDVCSRIMQIVYSLGTRAAWPTI